MKKLINYSLIGLCLGLASCSPPNPVPPATTSTPSPPPTAEQLGKEVFQQKCIACHGSDGTAGIGGAANLKTLPFDSVVITQTIVKGKNAMPSFATILTATEVQEVTAYIKTLHQ